MFDPSRLLDQMVRSGFGTTKGKKRKKRKGFGGMALGGVDDLARRAGVPGGGLGILGGLAIAAYEHYSQQRQTGTAAPGAMPPPTATPPPLPPGAASMPRTVTPPPPPPPGARSPDVAPPPRPPMPPGGVSRGPEGTGSAVAAAGPQPDAAEKAMLLVEAMIEAAKADGTIDPDEREKILGRLEQAGIDPEERSFVEARMALPPSPARLAERVRPGEPENRILAAEVYVASLVAIEVDTEAERRYLRDLGKRLHLDDGLIGHLHDDLGVERP